MTLMAALLMLSLPENEVLAPFRKGDISRRPIAGTQLTEVLVLRGRSGRWLEHHGRLTPPTPEGAAELVAPKNREEAERLVTLFEAGTVVDRAHAARVATLPPAVAQSGLVVERLIARTLPTGGAELVALTLHFEAAGTRREERVLKRVEGKTAPDGPPGEHVEPAELTQFWATLNAP